MPSNLSFDHFIQYDLGLSGISVQIELTAEKSVSLDAKIDTGATDCVFSRSVGEELGIFPSAIAAGALVLSYPLFRIIRRRRLR